MNHYVLSDVSATALVTLYCRALESQSAEPLLRDPEAERITRELTALPASFPSSLYRELISRRFHEHLVRHIALRARRYDEYVRQFRRRCPDGVVVNLGCGMDTRLQRIDDGRVVLFDLDLPEVIELKSRFLEETERYRFIRSSALSFDWMEQLAPFQGRPVIFLAEGLLMYLHEAEVRALIVRLCEKFAGAELVCELTNVLWTKEPFKSLVQWKLRRLLGFSKGATFHFGVRHGKDLQSWHPGIVLLDEWFYLQEPDKKLGALRHLGRLELLRKTQWTAHYRL